MGYCGKYLPYTTSSNEFGHGYVYKCTGCGYTTSIGHQYQDGCSCGGSPMSYVQWYDGSYGNIMTQFYRDNLEHNGAICGMEEFNFYDEQGNLLQEGTPWGEEDSIYTEVPICYKIITDLKPIK